MDGDIFDIMIQETCRDLCIKSSELTREQVTAVIEFINKILKEV